MSATGRKADREPFDSYATPGWCVRRLLEAVHLPGGEWLEPCAGDGKLVRTVEDFRPRVRNWAIVDIQSKFSCTAEMLREEFMGDALYVKGWHADFLGDEMLNKIEPKRFDVAITNPPFEHAMAFRDRMRRMADHTVLLLRLPWMASAKRHQMFVEDPPAIVAVLPNRPSFTPDGKTDATDYCWAVWAPIGWGDQTRMMWLEQTSIEERRAG